MNKIYLLPLVFALLGSGGLMAQTKDLSAALHINATDKGFLPSRLTTAQRDAISNPAAGLLIYNTDTNQVNIYDGTAWVVTGGGSTKIIDGDGDTQIDVEQGSDDDVLRFDTTGQERMQIASNGDIAMDTNVLFVDESANRVGIGTTSPNRDLTVSGDAQVTGILYDSSGDAGTTGQVLSRTGAATNWIGPIVELPAAPTLTGAGQLTDGGNLELAGPRAVFVQGDYAYVAADTDDGFQVIDISDPNSPVGVGQLTDGANLALDRPFSLFVQGNYAYVTSLNEDGLQVIDISDPTNPVGVGRLTDTAALELNGALGVFVQGNYAYVASFIDDGLQVIDISDPTNPTGVGQLTDGGNLELDGARSVFVQGNYAYVAANTDDGLQVIDISDPTNPTGVGQLTDGGSLELNGAISVFVQGNYAYVAANADDGFQVIDISDPTNPTGVGQLTNGGGVVLNGATGVFVQGNYAYVSSEISDVLQVIDISDPTAPVGVGQLTDGGALELDGAISVFVQGNYAYVTSDIDDGFQVIELGQNILYGLEVGSLEASGLHVDNHAQFNNYVDVKGGLSVGRSARIEGNVAVNDGNVGIGLNRAPTNILDINGQGRATSANWTTTSDQRIKRNITDYTSGLAELLQVRPVRFQYNELSGHKDLDKSYVGILAQEIETVLPGTVKTVDDSKGESGLSDLRLFDASELTFTLINAVKELKTVDDALKAADDALKASFDNLTVRVEVLEKRQEDK